MPDHSRLPTMSARWFHFIAVVIGGFAILLTALELTPAHAQMTPAQAQRKCPDGRQLTISGPIKKIVRGSRSRFLETDVKHPSGCRIVIVAVKGDPPAECQVGRQMRASGKTFISEGSAPNAQLNAASVTCR